MAIAWIMIATIIVSLVFYGCTVAVLNYKRQQLKAPTGGNSLSSGELKALVSEAVEEATAPLLAHIQDLETRLDTSRSLPPPPQSLLEAPDEENR